MINVLFIRLRFRVILVGFHFDIGRGARRYSALWHLAFCRPNEGIEDEYTKIILLPVLVIMTTSEAKSAPAIGSFIGPGNMLLFASLNCGQNSRITTAIAILRAIRKALHWRQCG